MKACTRCGDEKPHDQYQKRAASRDGLSAACKACLAAYEATRCNAPHRVAARQAYQKTEAYRASHTKCITRWEDEFPERRRATIALNNAKRSGKIIPWPVCAVPECDCTRVEAHHCDYSRPLDVVWLCPLHHNAAHALVRPVLRLIESPDYQNEPEARYA